MALSKDKKNEVVSEVASLLSNSKLTVIAKYSGTSVSSMQALRHQAKEGGTQIKVVKNRLFKLALVAEPKFKNVATDDLTGQLLYAFNSEDEVAPAQSLATFAKTEPQIQFVGGLSEDGSFINAVDIAALANLPSKDNLRAQLAGTIAAPLSGFVNVMAGNVRGVLNVLNARSEQIS
jgi:large subunit ribosomal protein L10